nr:MAG TPA: hypothetical protein [Caudoviricetes sp.]
MFNRTNLIIGAIYALSASVTVVALSDLVRCVYNEDRIAKKHGRAAAHSAMEYLQGIYQKRAHETIDLIHDSGISPEIEDKLIDLLDCPL